MEQTLASIRSAQHLLEPFLQKVKDSGNLELWRQAQADQTPRQWRTTTYAQAYQQVASLRKYLDNLNVKPLQCAICSNTRPEWLVADLSVLALNGCSVSVYTSLPIHDFAYILRDSDSRIVFAENQSQVDKLLQIHQGFTTINGENIPPYPLHKIITFEDTTPHPLVESYSNIMHKFANSEAFDLKIGQELGQEMDQGRAQLASLVYTSGSTGTPKGVMQTHGNHLANLEQVLSAELFEGGSIFLYLPLAHSFARLAAYVGLMSETSLNFPAIIDKTTSQIDLLSISQDLRNSNSEYVPSIPRLFEKAKIAIEQQASQKGLKGWLLRNTLESAKATYLAKLHNTKTSGYTSLVYQITAPLRAKLRETIFGTKFIYAVSGGAKLSPSVAEFFDSLDMTILQGYGLTETCVATNVNRPSKNKIGSVGPLFDGIEIRIFPDGEIAFKGPNVSQGYWNKPEETQAAWDQEGWFHTGDTGELDDEGYLFITGRKKEVIVSAGGKKIPPTKVEKLLEDIPGISQAVLFGSDRPYCVALIVPSVNMPPNSNPDVQQHPELWAKIEAVNEGLAPFEKVRKARFVFEEFSAENGLLTPTLKLRRHEIRRRYRDLIWEMYENIPHPATESTAHLKVDPH